MRRSRFLISATILVLFVCAAASTQSKRERGPRALAVVDVLANGRARLTPVAIFVDGKFYDANLYRATPTPMAVESDTLYDVLKEGKTVGTFTVGPVANVSGVWVADGKIKTAEPEKTPSEIQLGKARSTSGSRPSPDDEDKPPVLRRPGSTQDSSAGKAAPNATPPEAQKPAETATATGAPKPSSASASNAAEDEGRPTLRRGKPAPKPEEPLPASTTATASAATKSAATPQSAAIKDTYTAISDATRTEYRPYDFSATPEDKERYTRDLSGMALEALNRFTAGHSTAGVPVPGPLQDVKMFALDLDLNNNPTIILTASKPATPRGAKGPGATPSPALQLFVTVVARVDMYGNMRRLFTHVTDTGHLDTLPRLEFVDAVDAQGVGRGQLLFRQISDQGRSFALYRVGADKLWPLFEGASQK